MKTFSNRYLGRFVMVSLTALTALSACKKTASTPSDEQKLIDVFTKMATPGVYFYGGVADTDPNVPGSALWSEINTYSFGSTVVNSIVKNGGNIYACGLNQLSAPVYWVNGVEHSLPISQGYQTGRADKIAVAGADIYVTGLVTTTTGSKAVYWKNGEVNDATNTFPTDYIIASGNDIYSVSKDKRTVCKNGNCSPFPTDLLDFDAMTVVGTDVYLAGSNTSKTQIAYWKNGNPTTVKLAAGDVDAVFVKGNDVYLSGSYANTATGRKTVAYWKNGAETILPAPSSVVNGAFTFSLYYSPYGSLTDVLCVDDGNNVYVGGYAPRTSGKIPYSAIYWRNGQVFSLSGNSSILNGVVLVK